MENNPINFVDPTGEVLVPAGQAIKQCVSNLRGCGVALKKVWDGCKWVWKQANKNGDAGSTKETITRKTSGADHGKSIQVIERDANGNVISRTHTVTTDEEIVHQYQNQIGEKGAIRQFPDEWTGTETINAPYENVPPKFRADKAPGGRY